MACCAVLTVALALANPTVRAQDPSGCEDLSAIPETPGRVFERDIQPLLDGCLVCHGAFGGLSLAPDQAYEALVGVASNARPDLLRVDPGDPAQSVLFRAINCEAPGGPGVRMLELPKGTPLNPEDQALIRDWIRQGAGDFIQRDRFEQP